MQIIAINCFQIFYFFKFVELIWTVAVSLFLSIWSRTEFDLKRSMHKSLLNIITLRE